jgi:small conductance mechanosensitive channel
MTIARSSMPIRLWLVLALLATPILAQEAASDSSGPAEDLEPSGSVDAEQLLDDAQKRDIELNSVVQDLKTAEGEDLTLLRNRFDELAEQQHTDLEQLLKSLGDRQKNGQNVDQLELQAEQLLKRSSRRLRTHITSFERSLQLLAAQRDTVSGDDLEVFEHRVAVGTNRLDHLFLDLIKLSETMRSTGMPVEDETEFLQQQLSDRGTSLLGVLELTKKQLDELQEMAKRAPDNADVQAKLFATEERYDSNKAALQATIHMMKTLGMDYDDLEVRILETTGEITPEAVDVEVAGGLAKQELSKARNYLVDNGPRLLIRLLLIIGILLVFWLLARFARHFVSKVLNRSHLAPSELLKEMVITWTGRLVLIAGLIVVLSQLGINLGPVLAGLGIAGFIVGFALQDTLSNFAAGTMILFYQPYDVGDFVEAAGIMGKVRDMNLVSTRILTPDHQTLIVPNSKIWGDVIRNVTAQPQRRVDLVFGISYEDDIAKAEKVLHEIVADNSKVLDEPEPVIKLHTLNDSSVDFVVRPWAKTDDYWDVHWDITRAVKIRFDEEGISIPYPQRDVHLIPADSAEPDHDESTPSAEKT